MFWPFCCQTPGEDGNRGLFHYKTSCTCLGLGEGNFYIPKHWCQWAVMWEENSQTNTGIPKIPTFQWSNFYCYFVGKKLKHSKKVYWNYEVYLVVINGEDLGIKWYKKTQVCIMQNHFPVESFQWLNQHGSLHAWPQVVGQHFCSAGHWPSW